MDEEQTHLWIKGKYTKKRNPKNSKKENIKRLIQILISKELFFIIILLFIVLLIFLFYHHQYNTNTDNFIIESINETKVINLYTPSFENKSLNNSISKKKNETPIIKNKIKRLFLIKSDDWEHITNKNLIHIAMCIDMNFNFPTLVSMISALENNNNLKNIIIYHLLFSSEVDNSTIQIFESLKEKYETKINYYFVNTEKFRYSREWVGGTKTIYYKLLLPQIFQDLDRIIYLDADTLIFKDLYEMFNLPFEDNYILGYPFHDVYKIDNFVKNATIYINGGVLLFNIPKILQDKKDTELIDFTIKNNDNLWFLEQDALNVVLFPKIGIFPLKYGIYMYGNVDSFEKSIQIRIRFKLNRTEVIEAIKDPSVVHFSCCNPKVWYRYSMNEFGVHEICNRFHKEFYYYANKSKYYDQITKEFLG